MQQAPGKLFWYPASRKSNPADVYLLVFWGAERESCDTAEAIYKLPIWFSRFSASVMKSSLHLAREWSRKVDKRVRFKAKTLAEETSRARI